MTLLLDTHFLTGSLLDRNDSPNSRGSIATARGESRPSLSSKSTCAVMEDPRFSVDDIPLVTLIRRAVGLEWTRDPFDRMLVAHSTARRLPLCTTDRSIRAHHRLVATE
ncbi:MAG: hypothetical protein AUG80_14440 [Candidatus Rokubacteria bacterium 13_1_20CM_4_68_9]|nr:MAG: hypothetical protein AUH76_16135 [Candidatus Rokubacteria bacterium 13_1_40CM_4_67_11]OLD96320.1 MAG: hypothetical protein AUG80_14440 [Candidatus Rokubacteria bacterium 13_1_20CM_4_68_9]